MTDAPKQKDDLLDRGFQALKARETEPSDDLTARVLADADAIQQKAMRPAVPAKKAAFPSRVKALLGGWPALAGLATAGLAGVWIGASAPALLVQGSQILFFEEANAMVDFDPGFGFSDLDGGL